MAPYTPIEPFEVLSKKLGRAPEDIVKLDANENPYGPPPRVLEALGSMPFPMIYPDPECRFLRAKLAEREGIPIENIMVGCGADELIDLLMRCCLSPGDKIVDSPPTFTMYAFDADVNDAQVISVPRLDGFRINVDEIVRVVNEENPKVVFLTSPNNPDGSLVSEEDLLRILALDVLVVLDEAYIEFAGEESRMPWVLKYDNLVVLRTFSKSAALAGLRVGYGAVPVALAEYFWRARQPYNVSVAAETAALAALEDPGYLDKVRDLLIQERDKMMQQLEEVPFLEPYPSNANFILCKVVGTMAAKEVKDRLAMEHGVMVRHYQKKLLDGYIRISVGTPAQTQRLMQALREL
ncbi:unnamed protein product [Pedinophyceae sp. YPF-701]|nr:unnamed protein product [Pedinophyceae sp. YPF-701]